MRICCIECDLIYNETSNISKTETTIKQHYQTALVRSRSTRTDLTKITVSEMSHYIACMLNTDRTVPILKLNFNADDSSSEIQPQYFFAL